MLAQVGGWGFVVLAAPYPEGAFFVHVCLAHGDSDGKYGDVHHDEVRDLNGGMQICEVDDREAGGTCRSGLEKAVKKAETRGKDCDRRVIQLMAKLAWV